MKRCGKSAPASGATRAARQTPLGARPNRGNGLPARSSDQPQVGRSDGWPPPGRPQGPRAQNPAYRPAHRHRAYIFPNPWSADRRNASVKLRKSRPSIAWSIGRTTGTASPRGRPRAPRRRPTQQVPIPRRHDEPPAADCAQIVKSPVEPGRPSSSLVSGERSFVLIVAPVAGPPMRGWSAHGSHHGSVLEAVFRGQEGAKRCESVSTAEHPFPQVRRRFWTFPAHDTSARQIPAYRPAHRPRGQESTSLSRDLGHGLHFSAPFACTD